MIETAPRRATPPVPPPLSTVRGAALYIGALLGPGLLLLPGLAVTVAGPASLLAWVALLVLSALFAVVFAAFGLRFPSAGGVIGYVTAGLGPRAGLAAGWCFLAGVVAGAPVVCLIGASYVTQLTGGGQLARAGVGALLLLVLLALAKGGLRASAAAQLLLVGLLVGVVAVAVAGTAGSVRAANWTPFAPHGWLAVRARGRDLDAVLRRLGGGRAAHHRVPRPGPAADPRRRDRPGGDQRPLPGAGDRHHRRPRPGRGDDRAAGRAAAARDRPGGHGGGRRGGGRAHAGLGERLHQRRRRDGRAPDAPATEPARRSPRHGSCPRSRRPGCC